MAHLSPIRRGEGQGLAEYALILSIVAIAVLAVLAFLAGDVTKLLSTVANSV
jgi:Flp pilus assembly pilin Flp